MWKGKKEDKHGSPKYESKHCNKVKHEHKLNVDEQQGTIKHLKQ